MRFVATDSASLPSVMVCAPAFLHMSVFCCMCVVWVGVCVDPFVCVWPCVPIRAMCACTCISTCSRLQKCSRLVRACLSVDCLACNVVRVFACTYVPVGLELGVLM